MAKEHHFAARLVWTGAERGTTTSYDSYGRDYRVEVEGKPPLAGSADAAFSGDRAHHNPEDLLVASLSACHPLRQRSTHSIASTCDAMLRQCHCWMSAS